MEMLKEVGFCSGIENYSRILDGRMPGSRPYCLLDYFPKDFVCFIDESHQTVPQIGGMYEGDRSRKSTLVDYGFRLPSAMDNRPQTFDEWLSITPQMVFVSATPGAYEREHSQTIVEQIVRPTGIVDPEIDVRETKNQIDDLMGEIRTVVDRNERVLVTTLTKKMSEDLTDYLLEMGFRVRYLHSEVDTLERIQIIRQLRLGEYDVLVGVNLLREGLDLPEVSLVAILDADKEGFLRGETSLIQTIGRAARNIDGKVADVRRQGDRRDAQGDRRDRPPPRDPGAYNEEHGITPETIVKGISDITEFLMSDSKVPTKGRRRRATKVDMSPREIEQTMRELEEEMLAAAEELRFEYAAKLRDEIRDLRRELRRGDRARGRIVSRRVYLASFRVAARGREGGAARRVLPLLPAGVHEDDAGAVAFSGAPLIARCWRRRAGGALEAGRSRRCRPTGERRARWARRRRRRRARVDPLAVGPAAARTA